MSVAHLGLKRAKRTSRLCSHTFAAGIVVLWILPVLWLIFASLDGGANVFIRVPSKVTLENFQKVVADRTNQQAVYNSVIISVGVSVLVTFTSTLAGYILSRYPNGFTRSYMMTILFMTTLPGTVLIVPIYKMYIILKLYDSLSGIILFMTATSLPYSIWLMKTFIDNIPIELEEAAAVDGASHRARLYSIVMPLILPGMCCVAIRAFSSAWGNFMTPYILLSSNAKNPAAVAMYKYIESYATSYGELAAFSMLYSFPSVILYALSQRFMSQGFALTGANK